MVNCFHFNELEIYDSDSNYVFCLVKWNFESDVVDIFHKEMQGRVLSFITDGDYRLKYFYDFPPDFPSFRGWEV